MNNFDPKKFEQLEKAMKQMQEKINAKVYSGKSGGGLVEAKVNGKGDVMGLTINVPPSDLQNKEDIQTLADLVIAAFKKAQEGASSSIVENMGSLFGNEGGMPDINELMEMTKDLETQIKKTEDDE